MTHQASPAEVQSVVVAINNLRDAEMGQTHPIWRLRSYRRRQSWQANAARVPLGVSGWRV